MSLCTMVHGEGGVSGARGLHARTEGDPLPCAHAAKKGGREGKVGLDGSGQTGGRHCGIVAVRHPNGNLWRLSTSLFQGVPECAEW